MSVSTKTQTGRPTYTPGSDKPPRKSTRATVVATAALRKTGEHKFAEGFFWVLGTAALVGAGAFAFINPPKTIPEIVFVVVWIIIALAFIPGAAVKAARTIGGVGGEAAKAWKASKKEDGAA